MLVLTLGTFSTSDEEGLCEENHVSEALLQGQALTPHVLVDREASGAGDAPLEAAGSSWTQAESPSPLSQMSKPGSGQRLGPLWPLWGLVVIFPER